LSDSAYPIVVLISGSGSNLQAIIDACEASRPRIEIRCVISNVAEAYGLQRAHNAGIPTLVVDHRNFVERSHFETALIEAIDQHQPQLVVLAGFMRILTADFVDHYAGRLMNIHPSLLPRYPGLNTHARALNNGDSEAGATVHFVTAKVDGGPVIIQARVPIFAGDDPQRLADRVLRQEHVIYPRAVQWMAQGRLSITDDTVLLDGQCSDQQQVVSDER
jgi:phosphoribosylglycinamide formyltransferase-1